MAKDEKTQAIPEELKTAAREVITRHDHSELIEVGDIKLVSGYIEIDGVKKHYVLAKSSDAFILQISGYDRIDLNKLIERDNQEKIAALKARASSFPNETITEVSQLLENTPELGRKARLLEVRALAERMMPASDRRYAEALSDLEYMQRIGVHTSDKALTLAALSSKLDLIRTTNRDQRFNHLQGEMTAITREELKARILKLLQEITDEDSTLDKVNAYINLGLNALASDIHEALAFYEHGRSFAQQLTQEDHPEAQDRLLRLINIESAAILQLPDAEFHNRANEALQKEVEAHNMFLARKHQRGAGDTATVIAQYYQRLGNKENALRWCHAGMTIAENRNGEFESIDEDVKKNIEKLIAELSK